jgi:hypothetical protein
MNLTDDIKFLGNEACFSQQSVETFQRLLSSNTRLAFKFACSTLSTTTFYFAFLVSADTARSSDHDCSSTQSRLLRQDQPIVYNRGHVVWLLSQSRRQCFLRSVLWSLLCVPIGVRDQIQDLDIHGELRTASILQEQD